MTNYDDERSNLIYRTIIRIVALVFIIGIFIGAFLSFYFLKK
jgi:hypothetical protein